MASGVFRRTKFDIIHLFLSPESVIYVGYLEKEIVSLGIRRHEQHAV